MIMNFEKLSADLKSYHIEGYVHQAGGEFVSIPLISHIQDNLYMGGCINGVDLGNYFGHVISLYPREKYAISNTTARTELKMYDSSGGVDETGLKDMVVTTLKALATGENVLVHCQAGLNRSGLVAGAALIYLGMSPEKAIQALRERRSPIVLSNKTFENYLLSLDEEPWLMTMVRLEA